MRVAGSQEGEARSNWQAAPKTARVVGAKAGVIEGEGGGGWAGPTRWPQLLNIGVVGNGGVLVKYKGIAEAISVDEQPRMEGNDAV